MLLNVDTAMLSAMAFWVMKDLNRISDEACWVTENVDNITRVVNPGEAPNNKGEKKEGGEIRKQYFVKIKDILSK